MSSTYIKGSFGDHPYYRPINFNPIPCEIVDFIICKELFDFIIDCLMFDESQFSFRPYHSVLD